ncbi:hypothetical protein ACH5RR_026130 [Cinchona calisaya]|uniref:Uncharacterized protein n=1 Tax=Cinchona calisaya TaxID=153742 RepID=A0ABD2Z2S5_9GENT
MELRSSLITFLSLSYLITFLSSSFLPWFVGIDFNAILDSSECLGATQPNSRCMADFNNIINHWSLLNNPLSGSKFTWTGNRIGHFVWQRLDRHFDFLQVVQASWDECCQGKELQRRLKNTQGQWIEDKDTIRQESMDLFHKSHSKEDLH